MKRKKQTPILAVDKKTIPGQALVEKSYFEPIGWNFRRMQSTTNSIWRCTYRRLQKYNSRLLSFEGKSFSEIENSSDHSHPWEDIGDLDKNFREILTVARIEAESLWQLDLGGKARLFGVREGNIFHIMWLDTEHKAYPVALKHT